MKRIMRKGLAVLLIFSFILGMMPEVAVSSRAADDTVIYEPMSLDYPVFNREIYTDINNPLRQEYYEEYAKDKGYYNVVAEFTGFAPHTKYTENKSATWDDFLGKEDDYYTTSVPYGWMKRDNSLEINLSATIHNDEHEHSKVLGLITANSLNYFSALFTAYKTEGGKETLVYKDINIEGIKYGDGTKRVGDMAFMPVTQNQRWLTLKVGPGRTFAECNHQKAYIEDMVVALRDVGAPMVWKAYPCDNDGDPVTQTTEYGSGYLRNNEPYYVNPDDTVYIRVDFYEGVRFSDNKPTHGDITAKLFTEGTGNIYATGNLYKLKDNYIVFKFENIGNSIGTGTGKSIKLVSLDLSELFRDSELNPMYGNNVQNIKPDSKYKGYGFSKAKSVITDLAGNPMNESNKKVALSNSCVVDSEPPYIKRVTYTGYMNNAEIKQKGDGKTHQSDILAGVGDKIVYTVVFNEQIKTNGDFKTWGQYQYLTARLNVKNSEQQNVEIKSIYTQQIREMDDGAAETVTTVTFDPFIVENGMTCDDSDGKIRIIEVMLQDGTVIEDISGNDCSLQGQNIKERNSNPVTLDTTPPAVQTSLEPDGNGAYTPIVAQKPDQTVTQFSFPFTVTDSLIGGLGGTDDAYGSFRWVNGKSAGKNYNFWYAVTASNTPPAIGAQEWNPGITGQSYTFNQVSAGNCIHILLADNEGYNLGNTKLEITGYDIAGNPVVKSFPLNYTADTVNPTAEEKSVTNEHDSSNNTEKIRVTARVSDDNSGLKEVFYQWVTDGSIPTQNSSGWTGIGAFSTGDEATDVTVYSAEIASGSKYTGDLYIKAADVFGNTDVIFIGSYTYDYTAPKFVIDYKKTGVSAEASLKITELEDKSAAVFMIQKPGTENTNTYYVSVVESVYAQCDDIGGDILNNNYFGSDRWGEGILDQFSWQKYNVTRESDSKYIFNFIQNIDWDSSYGDDVVLQNILNGNYYGEIKMKLLTGRVYTKTYELSDTDFEMVEVGENKYQYASKNFDNNNFTYILGDPHYAYPVVYLDKADGVFVQDITLKTVGKDGVDAYNASFTVPDSLEIKAGDFNPNNSSTYMRSTLKDKHQYYGPE